MSRTNRPSDSGAVIDLSSRLRRRDTNSGDSVAPVEPEAPSSNSSPDSITESRDSSPASDSPMASVSTLGDRSSRGTEPRSSEDGSSGAEESSHGQEGADADEKLDEAPSKHSYLADLLAEGKVQLRLDPRRPGVVVPERFAGDPVLALNLSWRFPNTDMVLNERGVAATLRFGGVPFRCQIPWFAIWGIATPGSDWLQVWTYDLPVELGGPPRPPDEEAVFVEPGRPKLSVLGPVEDEASSESSKSEKQEAALTGSTTAASDDSTQAGPPTSESSKLESEPSASETGVVETAASKSDEDEDGAQSDKRPTSGRPTLRLVR